MKTRGALFMLMFAVFTTGLPGLAFGAGRLCAFVGEDGRTYYTNAQRSLCRPVTYPEARGRRKAAGGPTGIARDTARYDALIVGAGARHRVDPDLVRAVIKVESDFNPGAVSPKGAMGLMQLMPQTASELGVDDPFDPALNIEGGVKYLSRLLDALDGDLALGLAAYNAGLSRVVTGRTIPDIRETKNYVERVLRYLAMLKTDLRDTPQTEES